MAKDLVSALGAEELNALMAVQLKKFNTASEKLNALFRENNCMDFNSAYQNGGSNGDFIAKRDKILDELNSVLDTMNKLRAAQHAQLKAARKE